MEHLKKYKSLSELRELLEPQLGVPDSPRLDGQGTIVHLTLDTRGRKGKIVTIVSGLKHNPATMEDIARTLKQYCGTGGTAKEGKIELQGDQRARAAVKLKEMNYVVK